MSRLALNISSLYFVQIANYLIPLVMLPYLVRTLGVSGFGTMSFAAAMVQYFAVVTEYGFNLSASRRVSIHRSEPQELGRIVSSVFFLKFLIMVVCAFVFCSIVLAVPAYRADWEIYFASYTLVLGQVIYPGWLYQGLERMHSIVILNVVSKLLCAGLIFHFVSGPGDIYKAAALQSAGILLSGCLALISLRKACPEVRYAMPNKEHLRTALKEGFHVFVSQVSAILVNGSNVFFLGLFLGPQSVGQYSVAEKIIKAACSLQSPVSNSIYPRVSLLFSRSNDEALSFLRKIFRVIAPMMAAGSLLLFVAADFVVEFIVGHEDPVISLMIRILSFLPLSVFIDNVLGTQILLNTGHQDKFMRVIIASGALSVIGTLILVPVWGAVGSAAVYLSSQVFLLLLMALYVKQAKFNLIRLVK